MGSPDRLVLGYRSIGTDLTGWNKCNLWSDMPIRMRARGVSIEEIIIARGVNGLWGPCSDPYADPGLYLTQNFCL